jgi:hypothetical protein
MTGFYDDTDKPLDIHNDRKVFHLLVNYQMLNDGDDYSVSYFIARLCPLIIYIFF